MFLASCQSLYQWDEMKLYGYQCLHDLIEFEEITTFLLISFYVKNINNWTMINLSCVFRKLKAGYK